jgi:hypothetical protein
VTVARKISLSNFHFAVPGSAGILAGSQNADKTGQVAGRDAGVPSKVRAAATRALL